MNKTNLFVFIKLIKDFFNQENFLEVYTPPMVSNPGMEVHIHPFEVYSKHKNKTTNLYLNTSPEFEMKKLLSLENENLPQIYNLNYAFRDEPTSPIHNFQFLMLEWYRKNAHYSVIMKDVEGLLNFLCEKMSLQKPIFTSKTIQDLFYEEMNLNILDYQDVSSIKKLAQSLPEIPLPESELAWDDYYFLIFLNIIEPKLKKYPALILSEYPAPLCALATLKPENPLLAERFEFYLNGIEIANAYNELTHYEEQKLRFEQQAKEKKSLYQYQLPYPDDFLNVLKNDFPPCAGIALGVERLFMGLNQRDN